MYKTRYTSLLERSLNFIQLAFSSTLHEISDEVSKQLKSKDQSETAQYILLYGKYESVMSSLGSQIETILRTQEFAFGGSGSRSTQLVYAQQWHQMYRQLLESYLKSRETVGPLILKNLRRFASSEPNPSVDFKSFARRSIQHVFDICHNEQALVEKFFDDGPLLSKYPDLDQANTNYAAKLEENRLSHLTTLHNFLLPYLSNGDLERICDLTNWLETMYMSSADEEFDSDRVREDHRPTAQHLLNRHLWPLSDALFLKAAKDIEHFKPAPENLIITTKPVSGGKQPATNGHDVKEQIQVYNEAAPSVSNAYPTVKTAVKLLIMYNDGLYERPVRLLSMTKLSIVDKITADW